MGATEAKRWTPAEDAILRARRNQGASIAEIAAELGRSASSVHCRDQRENIRKSARRLAEMFRTTKPELEMPEDPPPEYVLHERKVRMCIPRTTATQVQFRDPLFGYSAKDAKRRGISVQDALEICAMYGGQKSEVSQLARAYSVSQKTIHSILDGSFFEKILSEGRDMWTEETIEQLKHHWDAGLTCSEIGAEMGISRNAVIGKVHRLELEPRLPRMNEEQRLVQQQKRNAARVAQQREARGSKIIAPPSPKPKPLPQFVGSLNIPFADLREFKNGEPNQCRYIADGGPDFLACGNETLPGASYCQHCHGITHFKAMNISEEDRSRRAAHFRKMGRNPQVIITSPSVVSEVA